MAKKRVKSKSKTFIKMYNIIFAISSNDIELVYLKGEKFALWEGDINYGNSNLRQFFLECFTSGNEVFC